MARPTKKPSKTSTSFYWVLGVLALIGIAGLAYAIMKDKPATQPLDMDGLEDPQALLEKATGVGIGDPNAPVKMIEFGDYQCPGCGYFANTVKPALKQRFIDSGQVYFVFYDFPLAGHPHSFIVARAARCAGAQDRFWEYHDLVFTRQQEWSPKTGDISKQLVQYAKTLGLDAGAFESCLKSDQFADVVTANLRLGEQLGVSATPTVIIDGQNMGEWDTDALTAAIEQRLAAQGRSVPATQAPQAAPDTAAPAGPPAQ